MTPDPSTRPFVLVMVGKPARGKTYTARKIARYLTWRGHRARVFNVGNYRREHLGAHQAHSFFDPDNRAGVDARRRMAEEALHDVLAWLAQGGQVGIYDATNSTRARRRWVVERCRSADVPVIFIEMVCDDLRIVEANIRETKITSPDYVGVEPDRAVEDFRQRIEHYERAWEPISDETLSYIRLIDIGRRVEINAISGHLPGRMVSFLLNQHITPRPIYLTRHGESAFNRHGRIGGDSSLTEVGRVYGRALGDFVTEQFGADDPLVVWTSSLQRTRETAAALPRASHAWRVLDEIDAGICDGFTYQEIQRSMPGEYAARLADKFRYRYPRGESYEDVIDRLDPAILEIERQRAPILIVAHQAVLRALYAYFADIEAAKCPFLSIPLHTVIKLTPKAYGCEEQRIPLAPGPREHAPS